MDLDDVVAKEQLDAVSTYIIPSAISLVFCGLFGLVAVIFSILTFQEKQRGNLDMARKHSWSAKSFMITSYVLGIPMLIYAFFIAK